LLSSRSYPNIDPEASETRITARPYGTLVELSLPGVAPYPDDSRTTGITRKNGELIPYSPHYDDPTVAVVIPSLVMGMRTGQPLDAIVHFHGHLNTARKAIESHDLGGQVQRAGRPVLLIVPQGPRNARDSGIGQLEKPGGLARLLTAVEKALQQDGPLAGRRMRIGNVIISGHSGGYLPVSMCLEKGGLIPTKIREVWLMDAAYGRLPQIVAGLTALGSGQPIVRSVFTAHLADENMQIMAGLGRAGRLVRVWSDAEDQVTSPSLRSGYTLPNWRGHPLDRALERENALFISTQLDHTGLIFEREYFRRFLEAGTLGKGTSR
jgi:hypothetical protein